MTDFDKAEARRIEIERKADLIRGMLSRLPAEISESTGIPDPVIFAVYMIPPAVLFAVTYFLS